MTKLGRISNGALNALQRNPKDQTEVNTSSRRVARQVLIYLESADKNAKPRYTFGNGGKNGYMVTMIAGKEPTIVKDGNCLPSSEK